MGKINVLDFKIANLIAAGEVVERPSSVMKELIENSIDAGATNIIAEIRRGGISLIRVSDNGSGMEKEDIPVALKRHATSKISSREDLDVITTLGFRGEALAAISSVSSITIITKTKNDIDGTMLNAEGGEVRDISAVGTAEGTTVVVENLFYNVPARRKFLKKDSTEAMNVAALIEKVALSRPDISIQFIIDGAERFKTPGNGELIDTIYAIFGKDYSNKLIKAYGVANGITVSGYIGRSDNVRKNRNHMNVFINGRYVKSLTAMAAIEKAYTSYIAPQSFPVCALFLEINPSSVDVNVHPAKLEVKFANEQPVFETVYYTVKRALEEYEYRPEIELSRGPSTDRNPLGAFVPIGADTKGEQLSIKNFEMEPENSTPPAIKKISNDRYDLSRFDIDFDEPLRVANGDGGIYFTNLYHHGQDEINKENDILAKYNAAIEDNPYLEKVLPKYHPIHQKPKKEMEPPPTVDSSEYRIIGEAFDCYVLVEYQRGLLIIDKHAAHERIIFEDLNRMREHDGRVGSQPLLIPITLNMTPNELSVAEEYLKDMESIGFYYYVEDGYIKVRAIPDAITEMEAESLVQEIIDDLVNGMGNPQINEDIRRKKALYQVACKAAIKGGRTYDSSIIEWLVGRILALPDIVVCPHGRPVAYKMSKTELDRQFDRIK